MSTDAIQGLVCPSAHMTIHQADEKAVDFARVSRQALPAHPMRPEISPRALIGRRALVGLYRPSAANDTPYAAIMGDWQPVGKRKLTGPVRTLATTGRAELDTIDRLPPRNPPRDGRRVACPKEDTHRLQRRARPLAQEFAEVQRAQQ